MKFKQGDRVVWVQFKNRGVVVYILPLSQRVHIGLDMEGPEDTGNATVTESSLEFEHIYDSPLYKALQ